MKENIDLNPDSNYKLSSDINYKPGFPLIDSGFINLDNSSIVKWDGAKWIEIDIDKLFNAIYEVCECLVLENMERPSFTFKRIEKLNDVLGK